MTEVTLPTLIALVPVQSGDTFEWFTGALFRALQRLGPAALVDSPRVDRELGAGAARVEHGAAGDPVLTRWLADHKDMVDRSLKLTPLGRAAYPDDIADAVIFLATGNTLITGQVLVVDGGRTM